MKNSNRAFTLIELLVVIAIIGILSSVVLASLSNSRASARDTKRVQDFRQLRTAVNMYRNNNNGDLPGGYDTYQISDNCDGTSLYTDLVDGGYLQEMPTDPAQSTNTCSGDSSDDPTLHGSAAGVDEELFYGWDGNNIGGEYCFSINNFETNNDGGSLSNINEQPGTSFGGDANLGGADFVYCFAE